MAFSTGGSDDTPMSDINTTPLVDVMLVMLIIFLIAVPVVVQNIKLKLPDVKYDPTTTKPENVSLSITKDDKGQCAIYWGMTRMGHQELYDKAKKKMDADIKRLEAAGPIDPDKIPEVHIRGDIDVPYKCVGGAIYTMQSAGFIKVGFISQPPPKS
ncbi:MAG: biopolymer transporter ExbD [Sphingomonas sp.]|uniref:ExbD/TolR family protein n=1 Tax=Sphingomonas sp. TaxID=28214 RepID=UPI0011FF38B9|nr:biopolymer transporter ExbD [Sphingomonas sp.]THD37019.1 MAG: biopolymer transporter ExbD [Sphingomonas sp.]